MFGLIVETVGYSSNYFNLSVFVENVSIEGYFFKRLTIQGNGFFNTHNSDSQFCDVDQKPCELAETVA